MNAKERMNAALNRECPDRVPTFEWFIDAKVGEALTGSADLLDVVVDLDIDGVNIRADYQRRQLKEETFEDEWGILRQKTQDCIPATLSSPITDITKHQDYRFPDPEVPQRFDSLSKAMNRIGHDRAVILNLRDGFSDMRDLLGYEQALMAMMLEPQAFRDLLERVVDYNLALADRAVRDYGVTIVATTDDVATAQGLLMRPEVYFDVIGPSFQRVIQGYKALGLKVIKHCDGNCLNLIDFWIEAGIDCLDPIDPEAGFDMGDFKTLYGGRICLKGNIDCKGALQYGTPEEVEAEVIDCLARTKDGGGLILSTSNTVHSGVKPENYAAMLAALKQYGSMQQQVEERL